MSRGGDVDPERGANFSRSLRVRTPKTRDSAVILISEYTNDRRALAKRNENFSSSKRSPSEFTRTYGFHAIKPFFFHSKALTVSSETRYDYKMSRKKSIFYR